MTVNSLFSALPTGSRKPIPFYMDKVKAGFPSPAEDYVEQSLSLDDLCIKNPAATFFVRAHGHSMIDAGIHDGDVLVVDRSASATHWKIIIATVNGEFLCKRLDRSNHNQPVLRSESVDFPDIHLAQGEELQVFGVVTTVVHPV